MILNITVSCKNKISPFSEPDMISKKLESSHLNFFSANLMTQFFENFRQELLENYRQISANIAIY